MREIWRLVAAVLALVAYSGTANAAWYEAKTRHFVIYSEQKPDELRDYASRLERFDSAVRKARNMDDPPLTDATRLTIYVLRTEELVGALAGYSAAAGFYKGRAEGPVAYVHRQRLRERESYGMTSEVVFFHEYLHHLMLSDGAAAFPPWMIEGYAEFFATATFGDDGSVTFGAAPHYRAFVVKRHWGLSLQDMLGGGYRGLSSVDFNSLYGRGWLLTHYLAFNGSRRGQVTRYLQGLDRGEEPLKAAEAAFGDLKQLDGELTSYLNRGTVPVQTVPAAAISAGPIQIRELTPGESAMMWTRMRSDTDPKASKAQAVAADARDVAQRFPDDPNVLTRMAIVEYQAENYDSALRAADRAIALNPRSIKALTYKGAAAMHLAKKAGASADWAEVRRPIAQANRLDPDAPEPLILFFETYVKEGAAPPPVAVKGLLYALEVAPHDSGLRLKAVRQLVVERRFGEAKAAFAPLAYGAHFQEAREKNLAIMAEVEAQRREQALALIDAKIKKLESD